LLVSVCYFLFVSLFPSLFLFLSYTFYVVVFLNDTIMTIFGFETFFRDALLTVLPVMKDVLFPMDILAAITLQTSF